MSVTHIDKVVIEYVIEIKKKTFQQIFLHVTSIDVVDIENLRYMSWL